MKFENFIMSMKQQTRSEKIYIINFFLPATAPLQNPIREIFFDLLFIISAMIHVTPPILPANNQ